MQSLRRCLLLLIVGLGGLVMVPGGVSAGGGVPIPAPAGTTWSVVAGYNTGTHSDHDGGDPHALDFVRTDAPTDWTPVLAPVDGVVTWFDYNGLTIVDANGYAHLLVHIDPDERIQRGLTVKLGDQVGRVFPVGYDVNGGVAHIHYAIHNTRGGGYLDRTIPFIGTYALEGRELFWQDEYNLHFGLEFTSTNGPNWTAPRATTQVAADPSADTTDAAPDSQTAVDPEPTWTVPADAPIGGWRTVGVSRRTSVAGLFANLDAPLSEVVVHHAVGNDYDRFDPADPESADVAVRSLHAGQAVWARVLPDTRWLPAPPTEPQQVTLRLYRGTNLVSWQGPDRSIAVALGNVAHLSHAYQYDPYTKTWRFWSPGGPDFLNTISTLRSGDAVYVAVRVGSTWTQLP